MQFREFMWMEMLRGMLKPIPQPPKWHAERGCFCAHAASKEIAT